MFCYNCGKEINDKAVVCIGCGVSVNDNIALKDPLAKKETITHNNPIIGFALSVLGTLWAIFLFSSFLSSHLLMYSIMSFIIPSASLTVSAIEYKTFKNKKGNPVFALIGLIASVVICVVGLLILFII